MTKTEYIRRKRSGRVERIPLSDARWGILFDKLETMEISIGNMYSDEIYNGFIAYSDGEDVGMAK